MIHNHFHFGQNTPTIDTFRRSGPQVIAQANAAQTRIARRDGR